VNYDDDMNFLRNAGYRGLMPSNLAWMWTNLDGLYIPLTWMSLGLDYVVWGMWAPGYHLTSVALHALNAVLFYYVVLALLPGRRELSAVVGALFFAVHPLRVESVAWITERRDVLSGAFFLLSMLAYLRYVDGGGRRPYAASIVCFALSLLSKPAGMAMPFLLLALDAYPLRRFSARAILEKLPYLALAIGAGIVAMAAQKHVGAAVSLEQHGWGERFLQSAYGLTFYGWKTLLPTDLCCLYLLSGRLRPGETRFIASIAIVVLSAGAVVALARRMPALIVSAFCYCALVAPVLGIAQSGQHLVADRYSYLPCMPFAVLAAAGFAAVSRLRAARAAGGVALACLAALTLLQALTWRESVALWTQALRVDDTNQVAYQGRGMGHLSAGRNAKAIADFDAALAVNPRYADAVNARGYAKLQDAQFDAALADFDVTIEIEPKRPLTIYYRGLAHAEKGDEDAAIREFERALREAPRAWPSRAEVQAALDRVRR